ncbi:Magnesium chelatase subunit ChlI [Planctomycetales bacterium 10988]|nr:Magnesium chelatase subunit ChlI [Planctomycetales bacterium 10988]
MLAKLNTFSLLGIEAVPVEVEVDVSTAALPKTILVGLPEAAVRESTQRVERAIVNSGFERPQDRVTINLAPGDLPKQAAFFDLSIALGVLAASGQMESKKLGRFAVVGELALDGSTRPLRGALSMAMAAAKQGNIEGILVPRENAAEAAVVESIPVYAISSLSEAIASLSEDFELEPTSPDLDRLFTNFGTYEIDYSDVRGQEMAKRALTVAAAGSHNCLMVGPPGSGKTMLAQRMPTIMPTLSAEEAIETTRIYSAAGLLPGDQPLLATRPFRSPHHTISEAGLVGGGTIPNPGEISLSHNGVLFLDELPEFNRRTLEVLRQPLEENEITISRARMTASFPADFILISALNPCPCGFRNDVRRSCNCSPAQIERYMGKLSGPLLDRMDIQIEVPAVPFESLASNTNGTSSEKMREMVDRARQRQAERFRNTSTRRNGQMKSKEVRSYCQLNHAGRSLLKASAEELGLSARAHDKILRISRTIADLEESPTIEMTHLAEAINYRSIDRRLWR